MPSATGEDTTTLIATSNQISDLGALTGLAELEAVTLDHNKIVDLGPLSGATKLSRLLVSDNKIADLTPLPAPACRPCTSTTTRSQGSMVWRG